MDLGTLLIRFRSRTLVTLLIRTLFVYTDLGHFACQNCVAHGFWSLCLSELFCSRILVTLFIRSLFLVILVTLLIRTFLFTNFGHFAYQNFFLIDFGHVAYQNVFVYGFWLLC